MNGRGLIWATLISLRRCRGLERRGHQKTVRDLGIRIESDEVLDLDPIKKTIKTVSTTYLAHAIIIASGARPRRLNVPGEEEYTGRGVSYCATCDAPFYKEKNVVIVGVAVGACYH